MMEYIPVQSLNPLKVWGNTAEDGKLLGCVTLNNFVSYLWENRSANERLPIHQYKAWDEAGGTQSWIKWQFSLDTIVVYHYT